ncbi:hypothetical protein B0H13DRAFT_2369762 [Mycena leptocephala]|nr:hypothetical protein B0H13DRAFT_2369762 [Mycena leptocephala]
MGGFPRPRLGIHIGVASPRLRFSPPFWCSRIYPCPWRLARRYFGWPRRLFRWRIRCFVITCASSRSSPSPYRPASFSPSSAPLATAAAGGPTSPSFFGRSLPYRALMPLSCAITPAPPRTRPSTAASRLCRYRAPSRPLLRAHAPAQLHPDFAVHTASPPSLYSARHTPFSRTPHTVIALSHRYRTPSHPARGHPDRSRL